MIYLPWAGSLQPDTVTDPVGQPGAADPQRSEGSHGSGSHGASSPRGFASGSPAADPGAFGQAISNRLFSAGLDLHFVLMLVHDEPGRRRLEHAVAELDEAIKDLRHLMLAITQRLA